MVIPQNIKYYNYVDSRTCIVCWTVNRGVGDKVKTSDNIRFTLPDPVTPQPTQTISGGSLSGKFTLLFNQQLHRETAEGI